MTETQLAEENQEAQPLPETQTTEERNKHKLKTKQNPNETRNI